MNRITTLALAVATVALCAVLWHLTETNTECRDRGGLL